MICSSAIAAGAAVAGTVVVGHAHIGRAQLAGVARGLFVPGAPGARDVAARMGEFVVVEIEGAAAHRLVVGYAVVALVHAARRHQVGLPVAGHSDLAGRLGLAGLLVVGHDGLLELLASRGPAWSQVSAGKR